MKKWQRFALSAVLLGNLVATPVWAEEYIDSNTAIIGDVDSRTPVLDRSIAPYKSIVRLETSNGRGTGFLVARDVVLTAAHCITDSNGQFVQNVKVVPAYHYGQEPYGSTVATKLSIYSSYRAGYFSSSDDIGIIKLDTPLGDTAGKMYPIHFG